MENATLDTIYTWNFFGDQSPIRINYAARLNGIKTRPVDAPCSYLELGCGNGVTANTLAACYPQGRFVAVDISRQHIANALALKSNGQLGNIDFIHASFDDLLDHDLPKFDYISAHGVYSWISPSERMTMRRIIDKFLQPHGLVHLSYNALPGWAPLLPLCRLLQEFFASVPGDTFTKLETSLQRLEFLKTNNALYFRANPQAAKLLDELIKDDPHYLVHEYLSPSWLPQYFAEVAAEMAEIGMRFCAHTEPVKNHVEALMAKQFLPILAATADPTKRESLRSLLLNEKFRHDVYCREEHAASRQCDVTDFDGWIFCPSRSAARTNPKEASELAPELAALASAAHSGTRRLSEIRDLPELAFRSPETIVGTLHRIVAEKRLVPLACGIQNREGDPLNRFKICSALNRTLLREQLPRRSYCFLASPVLGNGLRVNLMRGLLLLAGERVGLDEAPAFVVDQIGKSGANWRRKGEPVTDRAEALQLVNSEMEMFRTEVMPLMLDLGIIEPVEAPPAGV